MNANKRLQEFADALLEVSKSITIKASARGWGYLLEGETLNGMTFTKADIDRIERDVINCMKVGLIPVDFVAEEEARGFEGVETPDTDTPGEFFGTFLKAVMDCEDFYTPDWWKGESYYIQMVVEKIDLKTLFAPVCREYHIPIATSKGWASVRQRAIYARRFKLAESKGLKCVLLYCGDFDPDGLRISDFLRKNLQDIANIRWSSGLDGYDPRFLRIERFGLDYDFIIKNKLTWIENLITGSKKDLASPSHPNYRLPYVQEYLKSIGVRKCEANAIMKRPVEAEQLVRGAIEGYLGENARQRFKRKRYAVEKKIRDLRDKTGLAEAVDEALAIIEQEGDNR